MEPIIKSCSQAEGLVDEEDEEFERRFCPLPKHSQTVVILCSCWQLLCFALFEVSVSLCDVCPSFVEDKVL